MSVMNVYYLWIHVAGITFIWNWDSVEMAIAYHASTFCVQNAMGLHYFILFFRSCTQTHAMIFVPSTLDRLHFKKSWTSSDFKVLYHNKKKSSAARQFVSLEKSRRLFSLSNAWNREKKWQSWKKRRKREKRYTLIRYSSSDVMHSELSNERSVTDGAASVLMREFSFPWILLVIFIFFFCVDLVGLVWVH